MLLLCLMGMTVHPERSSVDVVKRIKQAFMLGCLVPKTHAGSYLGNGTEFSQIVCSLFGSVLCSHYLTTKLHSMSWNEQLFSHPSLFIYNFTMELVNHSQFR